MGRKIISKKHKGVKDPLALSKQQFEKIKGKVNKPPKDSDTQEIPKKFQAIQIAPKTVKRDNGKRKKREQMRKLLKTNAKKNNNVVPNKNKNKQRNDINGMDNGFKKKDLIDTADFIEKNEGWYPKNGRPLNPIPTVRQQKNEPDYVFRRRVKEVTDAVIYESNFRKKFNCEIRRNETGEVVNIVKMRDEKVREKRRLRDKERRLKLKMKKNKNSAPQQNPDDDILIDDIDEREKHLFRRENIAFGDIVQRPPELQTEKLDKLLKNQKESKNYLFLQNLKKTVYGNAETQISASQKSKKELEEQREAAVLAYRQHKASKLRVR